MSDSELEERLRVARRNVRGLQETIRTREDTLRRCCQRCEGFADSLRTALAALNANPPSAGELRVTPSPFPDSSQAEPGSPQANLRQQARAEVTAGAIFLSIALLCFSAAWFSVRPGGLAALSYAVFVAGLNLLWNGLRQLGERRGPRCEVS